MTIKMTARDELVADTQRALQQLIWNGRARLQVVVREYGLTVPQASFLLHLNRRGGGATMGEVTDALQFTASTTTSIADRLVNRGLVERGINPEDRRVVVALLTTEGQSLVDEIQGRRARSFADLLEQFPDSDIEHFHHMVERIVAAMEVP
jgi:DNA-binding MarR family transcriptional regulator